MPYFAVIDTETTWQDNVMSIGVVISGAPAYTPLYKKYYILTPYKDQGGMFTYALYTGASPDLECSREEAMRDLTAFLSEHGVTSVFAYNAAFDCRHLTELREFSWFDIMRLAAYRQHNPKIPQTAECCMTGRLKSGYGVEDIYRMLSGNSHYHEIHNALTDAMDELEIMRMLGKDIESYGTAKIN